MYRRTGLFLLIGVPLIVFALLVFAWLTGARAAEPSRLPPGVTCEQIAQLYAEWSPRVGKPAMRLWLSVKGYSRAQQREAERCLR